MAGTGVGKFSSTAGSNTANMTVNFAENMAPSNVNNAARELMGHMRDMYEQLGDGYFEFGDGDGTYTVARGDADTITITSASDISSVYFPGRKIRITDGGANVVEGTIASSSHASTTQTVNLTGISLAAGTPTKVELGIDTAAFGGKIILDDDGDTYIEAPTDDTIDIYVAGAKDFVITANTFTAESGSTIAAQALTATGIDVTGAITATAASTITTADNLDTLSLISTDADANVGPVLRLFRNSASPADNDLIGNLIFSGQDGAGNETDFLTFQVNAGDVANGAEDGFMRIMMPVASTSTEFMRMQAGNIIFNEGSQDIDFRVESDGNTHMLFVDGGSDHVNIGTATDLGGVLNVSGTAVIQTADNTDTLTLISTDADANSGPVLRLTRDSSSPASDDVLGQIFFTGEDAGSNATNYASIRAIIADTTEGSEDGQLFINRMVAGTDRRMITMTGTATVFNEDSVDIDFRVESNGNANALFVNAGDDIVLIGSSSFSNGSGDTVGIQTAEGRIDIENNSTALRSAMLFYNPNGAVGNIRTTGSATQFNTSSDYRLKENVITDWNATTRLKQLKPSRFNFIADADLTVDGFLAHEVADIVPEAISGNKDATETKTNVVVNASDVVIAEGIEEDDWTSGKVADEDGNTIYPTDSTWAASKVVPVYQGIDQSKLVPLLVKTIQELEARIVALES